MAGKTINTPVKNKDHMATIHVLTVPRPIEQNSIIVCFLLSPPPSFLSSSLPPFFF
jgi:hypothetical protein